jgi:transcriptional regulator with XRE-family HTH domain
VTFEPAELPPFRLLDPAVVRQRRLALGISEKDLAAHLGVSVSAISGIESYWDQRHYDVAFVVGLAEALSVPVTAILASSGPPASDMRAGGDKAEELGALLASAAAQTPVEALCDSLALGLVELAEAVEELGRRLAGTGMVVHKLDGQISLQPVRVPDKAALAAATRAAIARNNLASDRLSMIRNLASRPRQIDPRFSDPWVGGHLVNAGIVERLVDPSGSRKAKLTDDVRFSLMIDEPGA